MRNVADEHEKALGEQPPDLIASAEKQHSGGWCLSLSSSLSFCLTLFSDACLFGLPYL